MSTYVAERTATVDGPAVQENLQDIGMDEPTVEKRQPGPRDEWRWIPDPADVDAPSPPTKRGPSSALLMALAWANSH